MRWWRWMGRAAGLDRRGGRSGPGTGRAAAYLRLLGRMLDILAEDGWLRRVESGFAHPRPGAVDNRRRIAARYARQPACKAELSLAAACGEGMPGVLRGTSDPLQILFPEGSIARLEQVYEESPFARLTNTAAAETIARAVERCRRGRLVRILEIGAGTGGTTSYVLPRLPANRCEYVFTDVTSLFTALARDKFRDAHFRGATPPSTSRAIPATGVAHRQFDVVLAANVLHATSACATCATPAACSSMGGCSCSSRGPARNGSSI